MIIPCCGSCHRSPKYWEKPYEFYPEHFLDDSGNLRNNVEGFLPFLIGKKKHKTKLFYEPRTKM